VNHTRVLADGMGSIYAVLPAEDCVQGACQDFCV
jgi:hypothetical protein